MSGRRPQPDDEVLLNPEVLRAIQTVMRQVADRDYAALGISDPAHIAGIESSTLTHPGKFVEWNLEESEYWSTHKINANLYLFDTPFVCWFNDGSREPSAIYAHLEIHLNPLNVRLISVTN